MLPRRTIDLGADLDKTMKPSAHSERVDELLIEALDALAGVVPYDVATIFELASDDELRPRVSRGPLARPSLREVRLSPRAYPSMQRALERRSAQMLDRQDGHDGARSMYGGLLELPYEHACMVVPLQTDQRTIGLLILHRVGCEVYAPAMLALGSMYGRLIALALDHAEQAALLRRMRGQLAEERTLLLTDDDEGSSTAAELLEACPSPSMQALVREARRFARSDAPVCITGETGVGKEVVANAIHSWSGRRAGAIVRVNCAALPPSLIESELFGHTQGAFSGAVRPRPGRFQVANGGTLLLDEIAELPVDIQAKLLRVLQEGTFDPVGSDHSVRVDVRIVAATHVELSQAVAERRFRQDVYYRLHVCPLYVPPLRERLDDLPVLVDACLARIRQQTGRGPYAVSPADLKRLRNHPWPGNVRELHNIVERAAILAEESGELRLAPMLGSCGVCPVRPAPPAMPPAPLLTLEEVEREHFRAVLAATDGRLYGEGGAAEILGLNPSTARSRMLKLGLGGAREFKKSVDGRPSTDPLRTL